MNGIGIAIALVIAAIDLGIHQRFEDTWCWRIARHAVHAGRRGHREE